MHNGPHDVGGVQGFGAVDPTSEESAYPEGWEGRCIGAIIGAIGAGAFNVDEFRARIEELPPAAYWSMGYYRRWLHTLERNLILHGTIAREQIDERIAALADGSFASAPARDERMLAAIGDLIEHGAPLHVRAAEAPRFEIGDRVRTRRIAIGELGREHTRLPGYVQGRSGVVVRRYPAMHLPDASVRGEDRVEHVYAVSFAASDLWSDGDPRSRVSVDVFESYIEREED
jgi:nitrile hydratase